MSTFFIRYATSDDTPSIKKIADGNKTALGFLPRPKINEAIQQRRIFVLCTDQELAGFVIFRHRRTDTQTTLSDICVDETWRGHEGGRLLVEALTEDCVKLRRSFIRLKCPVNLPANHFYEKVGFRRVGIENGKHRPLNIWQLDIDSIEAD